MSEADTKIRQKTRLPRNARIAGLFSLRKSTEFSKPVNKVSPSEKRSDA